MLVCLPFFCSSCGHSGSLIPTPALMPHLIWFLDLTRPQNPPTPSWFTQHCTVIPALSSFLVSGHFYEVSPKLFSNQTLPPDPTLTFHTHNHLIFPLGSCPPPLTHTITKPVEYHPSRGLSNVGVVSTLSWTWVLEPLNNPLSNPWPF